MAEQSGGDVVDAALDAAQDEISSQLAEVESRELAHIENALERMRQGTYGQCEICDGKIPLARLSALPYAMTCIDCQRAAEAGGGVGGNWATFIDSDMSYSDLEG
jgi:DnaK suppressor protein